MSRALPLLAALALVSAIAGPGCAKPAPREEPAQAPPEVTLYGVKMNHYRGGHVAALGRAARVTYQRASGELTAYESYLRFPSRNAVAAPPRPRGRRSEPSGIEVRAPLLVGNLGNRQAEAQGGVLLRSSTGMAGQTERVFFDGAALTARGETRVKVTAPGYTLEADRFSLLFEPEEFTFDGNVESRVGGKP
jgi:hypothetical protein